MMVLSSKKTKIPNEILSKKYPSEMKVINQMKEYFINTPTNYELSLLLKELPDFNPLLLKYNPETFLSDLEFKKDMMVESTKNIDQV